MLLVQYNNTNDLITFYSERISLLPIWITVAFSTLALNFSLVASGPVMGSTLRYDDTARNSRFAAGRYTSEGLHSQSCKSSLRKKINNFRGKILNLNM